MLFNPKSTEKIRSNNYSRRNDVIYLAHVTSTKHKHERFVIKLMEQMHKMHNSLILLCKEFSIWLDFRNRWKSHPLLLLLNSLHRSPTSQTLLWEFGLLPQVCFKPEITSHCCVAFVTLWHCYLVHCCAVSIYGWLILLRRLFVALMIIASLFCLLLMLIT